jgi:hypothetical protein
MNFTPSKMTETELINEYLKSLNYDYGFPVPQAPKQPVGSKPNVGPKPNVGAPGAVGPKYVPGVVIGATGPHSAPGATGATGASKPTCPFGFPSSGSSKPTCPFGYAQGDYDKLMKESLAAAGYASEEEAMADIMSSLMGLYKQPESPKQSPVPEVQKQPEVPKPEKKVEDFMNYGSVVVKTNKHTTALSCRLYECAPLYEEGNINFLDGIEFTLEPGTQFSRLSLSDETFVLGKVGTEPVERNCKVTVKKGTRYSIEGDVTGVDHETQVDQEFYLERGTLVTLPAWVPFHYGDEEEVFTTPKVVRLF